MLVQDGIFDIADTEEDALFLMANLYPEETGLPRVIYVSEKGQARHDVRVKVSGAPGDRMRVRDMATMSVRPSPQLLHGKLSGDEQRAIGDWIARNEAVLVDYWNEALSTSEMLERLRRSDA
jgi:hypothetical protein